MHYIGWHLPARIRPTRLAIASPSVAYGPHFSVWGTVLSSDLIKIWQVSELPFTMYQFVGSDITSPRQDWSYPSYCVAQSFSASVDIGSYRNLPTPNLLPSIPPQGIRQPNWACASSVKPGSRFDREEMLVSQLLLDAQPLTVLGNLKLGRSRLAAFQHGQ